MTQFIELPLVQAYRSQPDKVVLNCAFIVDIEGAEDGAGSVITVQEGRERVVYNCKLPLDSVAALIRETTQERKG